MNTPESRPTPECPDDDPHLWLEEIEGDRALAWVEAQNAATLERLADAQFAADRDVLRAIFDQPGNIPVVNRRGGRVFNIWRDAAHPRGLWRTTSFASFCSEAPTWDVVIDVDELAAKEGEDWVWRFGETLPPAHDRAIVHLARGGGIGTVLREFDLSSRAFVTDGFCLPEARSEIAWLDRDTLLLSSPLGAGMATKIGTARSVRLWRRGADPLAAPVLFETREGSNSVRAEVERGVSPERVWFIEHTTNLEGIRWLGDRTGPKLRLDVPDDAPTSTERDWLVVKPRTAWTVGGRTYAPDTVLGISLAGFLAGDRNFTMLFQPRHRRAIQTFFWCGGRLILSILDDLKPVFEAFTPSAGGWSHESILGLPDLGTVYAWPFDKHPEESNGDLLAAAEDPVTPPSLYLIKPGAAPQLLRRGPQDFDASGLIVTRHEAISTDGERIPYIQVGPPGESGEAPVHLFGYGGFGIPVTPIYHGGFGKLWLERGGTSVIAHIRGGGEFGTPWHEAARREGRRLSHDDFAAVAADLIRRGVTRPGRIAAVGGSNGGLLIANMLTRYPERFGALFCGIPVTDMRRFTKLLMDPALIEEFGDPDDPEDWKFLAGISAYHGAAPGKTYPPILFQTGRRDGLAHPGHARKMAAKLQTMGYQQAYFYELATGGHGWGEDHFEEATHMALTYRFLRRAIGWEP